MLNEFRGVYIVCGLFFIMFLDSSYVLKMKGSDIFIYLMFMIV